MKQKRSIISNTSFNDNFNDDELEVTEILHRLHPLILQPKSAKRKRSAIISNPSHGKRSNLSNLKTSNPANPRRKTPSKNKRIEELKAMEQGCELPEHICSDTALPPEGAIVAAPVFKLMVESQVKVMGQNDGDAGKQSHSDVPSSNKKRTRGSTKLSKIIGKEKKRVDYNTLGQPIGDVASSLANYLGVVARNMVPINISNWHKVSKELKEKLWTIVQENYEVDLKSKKKVISDIGVKWRYFKSVLTTEHIIPFIDELKVLQKPPEIYNFIEQSVWEEFVKSRLTKEFQAMRQASKKSQSKNIYTHRISRKGYAGLTEELKQNGEIPHEGKIDRCLLWKKARQDKDGQYVNSATKEKADKMDELLKAAEDGSLSNIGNNDILSQVLETPEHPGRVRGVGHFVTPSAFFNTPRRGSTQYVADLEAEIGGMKSQLGSTVELVCQLRDRLDSMGGQGFKEPEMGSYLDDNILASDNNSRSKRSSIDLSPSLPSDDMPPADPTPKMENGKPCRMALGFSSNIVARGLCFESQPNQTVHSRTLEEGNVRVSVQVVVQANALLPFPIEDEMTTVQDAIGSIVAWPRSLVLTVFEEEVQKLPEADIFVARFGNDMKRLWERNKEFEIELSLCSGDPFEFHLSMEDICLVVDYASVSSTCITVYTGKLYDDMVIKGIEDFFVLVNPSQVNEKFYKKTGAPEYIAHVINSTPDNKWILIPLNIGCHWILVVISLTARTIYTLDSIRKEIRPEIKKLMTEAFKILKDAGRTWDQDFVWRSVKVPKQKDSVACGFYVMRFMKEIIEDERNKSIIDLFDGRKTQYNKQEIDEVRNEWVVKVSELI